MLLVYPPQVTPDRYSYPLTPTGHVVAQASFAVQHLLLLAELVALARAQASSPSRTSRVGLWAGVVGLILLAIMELITMSAADAATDSPRAELINTLHGIPTLLVGAALVAGGIGFARSGRLPGDVAPTGWRRWVPLIIGG